MSIYYDECQELVTIFASYLAETDEHEKQVLRQEFDQRRNFYAAMHGQGFADALSASFKACEIMAWVHCNNCNNCNCCFWFYDPADFQNIAKSVEDKVCMFCGSPLVVYYERTDFSDKVMNSIGANDEN